MTFRTLAVLGLGLLLHSMSPAAEPWADPKLPVTNGLELWLDATRIDTAAKVNKITIPTDGKLAIWRDGSGKGRHLRQPLAAARPVLVRTGGAPVVRFDGDTDFLRATKQAGELREFTAFMVVIPRANPGFFRGFLALNAPNGRDYQTGLTIDMGPRGTPRFNELNIEGRGFGGARNLLKPGGPFGKLDTLEVRGEAKAIRLFADGAFAGERPRDLQPLSLEEITVGARYYTNGPGAQEVRGFARVDVAEVLLFGRSLTEVEVKQVRGYLAAKYAALRESLPPTPDGDGEPLVPIADPPAVQVFVPGFTVRELPVDLTNINNIKYRSDGTLVAMAYNGDIWLLRDTNGDGVEDKAELYWENKGRFRGPIGMDLTPPGYPHGEGVIVASKGRVSLILGKDKEVVVAQGWKEITQSVDAIGVAIDPKDGSVYFGRGTGDYTNAYRIDKDGKAHYDLKGEYGTILRVAPDFKSREVIATGIRFPVGLRFNKAGDLFATDQEGATWLPNGNPFDELHHIRKHRHYGFPPRHPKHLPNVIDEPSTFDYGPQHQSTCGLCFNEPVKANGPTFGPKAWAGDVFVTGYSRGKLYRTQLVTTPAGYVAKNQLFACLKMLTVDCCITPDGSLLVACHSGGPDWGSGPAGKGKLFKITYSDQEHPQPVLVYPTGPREVRVEFDRPVNPELLRDALKHTKLTAGKFVRAGDRFETLWPGYAVVQAQKATPRFDVPVRSVQLTPDRRTLILAVDPLPGGMHFGLTIPGMGRPAKDKTPKGTLPQHAAIDLDFDLSGVEAVWQKNGAVLWSGWLPSLDLAVSRRLTAGSAPHELFRKVIQETGELTLATQMNLFGMFRPAVQPGSRIDYEWPAEQVAVAVTASGSLEITAPGADIKVSGNASRSGGSLNLSPKPGQTTPVRFRFQSPHMTGPNFTLTWSTHEDRTPRPLQLHRALLPWADANPRAAGEPVAVALPAEIRGGSWFRGRREFFGETAMCFKCHSIHGQGGTAAPDLTNLVHRDYASVFRDITQPSFAINPDYLTYLVNTADGRTVIGVLHTSGEMLTITDQAGAATRLRKPEIESMKAVPQSVMPDDLLKKLGPDRTRDLLTFLLTPPPSMPRDYVGPEKRPKPRTVAEVNTVLAGAPNPPEKTRPLRVVLVAGPKDHGPGEHDYPAWQKAWKELLAAGEQVDVATAWEWPEKAEFAKADVMVFFQRGNWDAHRAADIDAFLERGGGLVYIHWAVDGQKDAPGFAKRIGRAWGAGSKFRHGPVDLTFNKEAKHPIARNLDRLALVDESYWNLTGELPGNRVIASAVEDRAPQPLFWSLEHAKGRVFVSIPGHYSWSFDDPLFRVLLLRGIAWTAREPVDRFNDLVWPGADVAK